MKCVMITVLTKSNMLMFMCSSLMQCNASLNHLLNSPCYLCYNVCACIKGPENMVVCEYSAEMLSSLQVLL